MKKIVKFYVGTPLILRIAIGLVIGICLGLFVSEATFVAIFGDVFVGALKAIAPVLVFVLVIASLAKAGVGIGGRFKTVVFFYMLSTFLAAAVLIIYTSMNQIMQMMTRCPKFSPERNIFYNDYFRVILHEQIYASMKLLFRADL